jgi:hypothetical protein
MAASRKVAGAGTQAAFQLDAKNSVEFGEHGYSRSMFSVFRA